MIYGIYPIIKLERFKKAKLVYLFVRMRKSAIRRQEQKQ